VNFLNLQKKHEESLAVGTKIRTKCDGGHSHTLPIPVSINSSRTFNSALALPSDQHVLYLVRCGEVFLRADHRRQNQKLLDAFSGLL